MEGDKKPSKEKRPQENLKELHKIDLKVKLIYVYTYTHIYVHTYTHKNTVCNLFQDSTHTDGASHGTRSVELR